MPEFQIVVLRDVYQTVRGVRNILQPTRIRIKTEQILIEALKVREEDSGEIRDSLKSLFFEFLHSARIS